MIRDKSNHGTERLGWRQLRSIGEADIPFAHHLPRVIRVHAAVLRDRGPAPGTVTLRLGYKITCRCWRRARQIYFSYYRTFDPGGPPIGIRLHSRTAGARWYYEGAGCLLPTTVVPWSCPQSRVPSRGLSRAMNLPDSLPRLSRITPGLAILVALLGAVSAVSQRGDITGFRGAIDHDPPASCPRCRHQLAWQHNCR